MAGTILIAIWLQNMLSYDRFHKNEDQLFVLSNLDTIDGEIHAWKSTPRILGPSLEKVTPEIEEMTRFLDGKNFLFTRGEKRLSGQNGAFVDKGFFKMFSFPLMEGGVGKDWENGEGIILTEAFAKSLFGKEDPLGKSLKLDSTDYVTVSGVLKDLPPNTIFQSPYYLSWEYAIKINQEDIRWGSNTVMTFVKLVAGTNLASFNAKIKNFIGEHVSEITNKIFAEPLKNNFLYNEDQNGRFVTGRIVLVRCFAIIGALLLLIACINFMNLSTAQSEKRAREVGVKKVIGASKKKLILQFLTESIILSVIAFVLAIFIVMLVLPAFNNLVETRLRLHFGGTIWLVALGFVLFTGLLAGSYPAFFLSSFKPIVALKGVLAHANSKFNARSILVVLQFIIATVLILSTIMITQDILYVQNRDKGYKQDGLMFSYMTGELKNNYLPLRNELLRSGAIAEISKNMSPVTSRSSDGWGMTWPGSTQDDEKTDFLRFGTDANMVKTMKMSLVEGRDIDIYKYPADSSAMLLTQSAVKIMRLKSPLGALIGANGGKWHVVGVLKDFIIDQPFDKVNPMLVFGPKLDRFNTIHYRLNPDHQIADNLKVIKSIFEKYNPQFPFEYAFVDASYAEKFKETKKYGQLSTLFAGLTIFISCLGLFGLITYMAEAKTKEIGIRKVLGASIAGIIGLLSKGFLKLIILAFIIAIPISLYIMHRWLSSSAYSISISWWWFAVTILMTLVIAFITVSFQALKAARANPVKSLKTE